jgi:hypothetical protein
VTRFQTTAASSAEAIIVRSPPATIPPTVSATAAPSNSGPSRLNTAARSAACNGVAARVATSAAIEFDAS